MEHKCFIVGRSMYRSTDTSQPIRTYNGMVFIQLEFSKSWISANSEDIVGCSLNDLE